MPTDISRPGFYWHRSQHINHATKEKEWSRWQMVAISPPSEKGKRVLAWFPEGRSDLDRYLAGMQQQALLCQFQYVKEPAS